MINDVELAIYNFRKLNQCENENYAANKCENSVTLMWKMFGN
jgi:hypothetical protein